MNFKGIRPMIPGDKTTRGVDPGFSMEIEGSSMV